MADIIAKSINSGKSLYVPDEPFQNMSSRFWIKKTICFFFFFLQLINFYVVLTYQSLFIWFLLVLYQNYHYSICVSNKKIHVSKIKHDPHSLDNDEVRVIADGS